MVKYMKKKLAFIILIFLLVITGCLYFTKHKLLYVHSFADGLYEVKTYAKGGVFCSHNEVIDIASDRVVYSADLCEANIIDVKPNGDDITIVVQSMGGEKEITVSP